MDALIERPPQWIDVARGMLTAVIGDGAAGLSDADIKRLSDFLDALLFATQENAWREGWTRGYSLGEADGRWLLADDLRANEEIKHVKRGH